jgi:hypothetical protein
VNVETTDLDRSIAVIRALLAEDFDTYRHLNAELGASANKMFAVVLGTAFTEAASRRFGNEPSIAEIVEFVADARASYSRTGEQVTAEDAEHMIRAALGEDHLIDTMDGRAMGAAQTAMLFALVHENGTSPDEVDRLLTTAAEQAEAYLHRTERG